MAMLTSDEVSSDTHANSDLIILGSRARQPLVNTFVGDSVTQSANLINPALNDPAIGYVHLIESPWNAEREAILVYSESEIGFATAATQLLNDNLQLNESASVVVVNNEQPAVVLERREDILISTSPAQFPGSQNPASSIDLVTSEPDSSTTNSNTIINIPGDTNQPTSGQTTVTNQQSNDRDGGLASNNVLLILALILAIVLLGKIGNDIYHSDMF
jgi:hypothetical protein